MNKQFFTPQKSLQLSLTLNIWVWDMRSTLQFINHSLKIPKNDWNGTYLSLKNIFSYSFQKNIKSSDSWNLILSSYNWCWCPSGTVDNAVAFHRYYPSSILVIDSGGMWQGMVVARLDRCFSQGNQASSHINDTIALTFVPTKEIDISYRTY